MNKKYGFTLIEMMIVVAIIAFLAALAIPTFSKMLAKGKRSEAYMNLHALCAAQKAHWAEHGTYSVHLKGQGSVGWSPEGYQGGGAQENFNYTYGFSGAEGQNCFTGKLQAPSSLLSGTKADKEGFVAYAVADIDGDGLYDILSVDQTGTIKIVQDDLND